MIPKASRVRIENATRNTELAAAARVADRFWSRLVGLLGRRSLAAGDGLILSPGGAIHMFFMRFPIDVVFVNKEGRILKTAVNVRPWRMVNCPRRTRYTLELAAGAVEQSQTAVGDSLSFTPA